jgi:hypothetical protein
VYVSHRTHVRDESLQCLTGDWPRRINWRHFYFCCSRQMGRCDIRNQSQVTLRLTASLSLRRAPSRSHSKSKVIPYNWVLRHEDVWGSGCIDPRFHDLGITWRWVISFTPLLLYPLEKSPRYPLDMRLGGPQSRSARRGEEKTPDLTGTRIPTPRSSNP